MRSGLRFLAWPLKLAYALASGVACVWLLSYMPAGGPRLTLFLPASASSVLHVPDGMRFLDAARKAPALQEFLDDPQIGELLRTKERRESAIQKYGALPALVRWLFPLNPDGVAPLVGGECALAALGYADAPAGDPLSVSPLSRGREQDGGRPGQKPAILVFSRLSGARGALVRLAGRFLKKPKNAGFYDLGGGLVAIGFNGAVPTRPDESQTKGITFAQATPLARVVVFPGKFAPPAARAGQQLLAESPQFRELADTLPKSVRNALLQPPALHEAFGLPRPPREIQIDFFAAEDGSFSASGKIVGALPALPTYSVKQDAGKVLAEAFLPIDARQLFLWYIQRELRIRPTAESLSRTQKHWRARFEKLARSDLDLERELWPAFGKTASLVVREASPSAAAPSLGEIALRAPFDGLRFNAREAAAELSYVWSVYFDKPPDPKLQHVHNDHFDGYLRPWMKVNNAGWLFAGDRFVFISDAGMLARSAPERALSALLEKSRQAPGPAPHSYFLRLDGMRLVRTAGTLTQSWLESLEEDIGAKEFGERYPDSELRVAVAQKLSALLGQLAVEVKPAGPEAADVAIFWRPGTLAQLVGPASVQVTTGRDAGPTAPAPTDDEDVAPPPPAQ